MALVEHEEAAQKPLLVGGPRLEVLHQQLKLRHDLGVLRIFVHLVDGASEVELDEAVGGRVGDDAALYDVLGPGDPDLLVADQVHELDRDQRLLVAGHHVAGLQHGVVELFLRPDHQAQLLPRQAGVRRLWLDHL